MQRQRFLLALLIGVILAGCNGTVSATPEDRTVSWEEAIQILNSGDVVGVVQLHSLKVTLELRDGSIIHTVEPGIDDIFQEVERCGARCQAIMLATE